MKRIIHKYGTGFPLVFFHGWGFDSQVWMGLVPKLSPHYQLIFIDLPGFGQCPIMEWGEFSTQVLKELPEQFALLGWSMGGLYAMRLALEASERVACLISVSASPFFLQSDSWPGISLEVFQRFYQKISLSPQATLNEFLGLNGLDVEKRVQFLPEKPPSLEGLELGLNILETWDFRYQLKLFEKPALFLFGRLDPIVPVKTMRMMQHTHPHFKYVLLNQAAHIAFLSHVDLFIQEIKGFI